MSACLTGINTVHNPRYCGNWDSKQKLYWENHLAQYLQELGSCCYNRFSLTYQICRERGCETESEVVVLVDFVWGYITEAKQRHFSFMLNMSTAPTLTTPTTLFIFSFISFRMCCTFNLSFVFYFLKYFKSIYKWLFMYEMIQVSKSCKKLFDNKTTVLQQCKCCHFHLSLFLATKTLALFPQWHIITAASEWFRGKTSLQIPGSASSGVL